ncbi:hybrid sensor histidine kinase/response regulator [Hydrogenophaga sp. RWCD_12]|uniref:ATP-binding response regulator n=1 Tax=Hydrogenophaga sp. RWCD_12 TaxID=3391190 RepID=UPI0039847DCD
MNAPATADTMDLRVRTELVDLLFAGSKVAVATTFVGPVLVGWMFLPLIGLWMTVVPALAILGLHTERALFIGRFQRARALPDYLPEPWARGTQRRLAIMGTAISLWVLVAMLTRDPRGIFHSAALLVVLAAGSLQYSVYPRTVEHYLTPLLLGCAAQLVWLGRDYWVSAFFLCIAWLTLTAASRRFGRSMRHNIELRLLNEQLNAELKAQKAVVEEVSAAKTRFLTAASHDLRQPVQAVMLLSEALQERGENPGNRTLLHKLRAGVNHFANSVDEIMDIAQLDAGSVQVQAQPVRVRDLLDRVDGTFRDVAEAKGLGLFIRPPRQADATVLVDPALTWRIVSNLVSNAIRYTPAGTVMVAVRNAGRCADAAGRSVDALRLEVRDSGVGIAPTLHAQVFEEFYQVDNLHRDRREGIGLGLAVSRRLALLMQLPLALRSQPGQGSVFSLTMPVCDTPADEGSGPAEEIALDRLCVLVVDDDSAAREATVALLTSWGVCATAASNAIEAAEQAMALVAQGKMPDALLTDHWLPEGRSSEDVDALVRERMSARDPQKALQLCTGVVTGDIRRETRDRIQQRGWAFWQKPVRPAQLRQWLGEVARQQLADTV